MVKRRNMYGKGLGDVIRKVGSKLKKLHILGSVDKFLGKVGLRGPVRSALEKFSLGGVPVGRAIEAAADYGISKGYGRRKKYRKKKAGRPRKVGRPKGKKTGKKKRVGRPRKVMTGGMRMNAVMKSL